MDMPDEIWCDHGQIFYNTKGGTRYIKADLAQSLADALEGVLKQCDEVGFGLDAQKARTALANYRKGE